jgi:hypothetical protein
MVGTGCPDDPDRLSKFMPRRCAVAATGGARSVSASPGRQRMKSLVGGAPAKGNSVSTHSVAWRVFHATPRAGFELPEMHLRRVLADAEPPRALARAHEDL